MFESIFKILKEIFETGDRTWRGIGPISGSGYHLREKYKHFDAELLFDLKGIKAVEPAICISGEILTGNKKPYECDAFGTLCKPEKPLGAPMVSSEGACAAYYKYNLTENSKNNARQNQ